MDLAEDVRHVLLRREIAAEQAREEAAAKSDGTIKSMTPKADSTDTTDTTDATDEGGE